MAKVRAQVTGGSIVEKEATTVAELKSLMSLAGNYTATVNGEPTNDDYELSDFEFVSFALAVKGAKSYIQRRTGNVIVRTILA